MREQLPKERKKLEWRLHIVGKTTFGNYGACVRKLEICNLHKEGKGIRRKRQTFALFIRVAFDMKFDLANSINLVLRAHILCYVYSVRAPSLLLVKHFNQ